MVTNTTATSWMRMGTHTSLTSYLFVSLIFISISPWLLRFNRLNNFAAHGLVLMDSPAFHLSLDMCTNGKLYNIIVRGGNRGGLDGFDVCDFLHINCYERNWYLLDLGEQHLGPWCLLPAKIVTTITKILQVEVTNKDECVTVKVNCCFVMILDISRYTCWFIRTHQPIF